MGQFRGSDMNDKILKIMHVKNLSKRAIKEFGLEGHDGWVEIRITREEHKK